jgi:hypothetical protein
MGAGGRKWGEMKPRVFLPSIQKFKFFFFFGADVEDATSTRDGRWTDVKNYSKNKVLHHLMRNCHII